MTGGESTAGIQRTSPAEGHFSKAEKHNQPTTYTKIQTDLDKMRWKKVFSRQRNKIKHPNINSVSGERKQSAQERVESNDCKDNPRPQGKNGCEKLQKVFNRVRKYKDQPDRVVEYNN